MQTLPVVSTIPTGRPDVAASDPGYQAALRVENAGNDNNALEIVGKATAGAGSAVLLRWFSDLSPGWRRWKPDKAMAFDAAVYGGEFSATYRTPVTAVSYWVLYVPAGTVTASAQPAGY